MDHKATIGSTAELSETFGEPDVTTCVPDEVQGSATATALEAPSDQSLRVPCYCEENVWRLACRKLYECNKGGSQNVDDKNCLSHQYHVVFVSNPRKCVPMFHQLAAKDPKDPCFWDYHVILLCTTTTLNATPVSKRAPSEHDEVTTTVVFDMDSYLPYPCPLKDYVKESFSREKKFPKEYNPRFR
jgi:protein N-terminal glutamine amidohydrolase